MLLYASVMQRELDVPECSLCLHAAQVAVNIG
jgi:hypothetical protein